MIRTTLLVAALALAVPATAPAQSALDALDAIEKAVGGRASEFARVDALLSDPDPNRRLAAMELLLASGDPQYEARAREFGLFSDDPALRQAAVQAVLSAGGAFRMVVETGGEDSTDITRQISHHRAAVDGDGRASFAFTLQSGYDEKADCWVNERGQCVIVRVGEAVQLGPVWNAGASYPFAGEFALGDAGALEGFVFANSSGRARRARIPLID